ncbi:MAG: 7-cyano-7-deazaguanine synthase [Candidatus Aenigmatarchaeota archaeon]
MTENNEKTVCLVSGGIDSPVAAAMMGEKMEIVPLHFVLHPYYCEETFSLSIRALKRLERVVSFDEMALFPWGNVLKKIFEELEHRGEREYSCVLCRRSMFLAASLVCEEVDAKSITTGEVMGQKASQTMENLRTTSWSINVPIHRPLMGMDKEEIVRRSKDMGLYMSTHAGCCNATPDKPRTQSDPEKVEELSEEVDLEGLIRQEAGGMEVVETEGKEFYEIFHDYMKKMVSSEEDQ